MDIVHGAKYQKRGTDEVVTLLGLKRNTVVVKSVLNDVVEIPRDEFLADAIDINEHDHVTYCCDVHGTHASPHQGCIFR